MRLALFGGSFDPPHVGHLLAASDAHEALELDRLLFVPAAAHPFKRETTRASPADRLAMLRRMVDGDGRFDVDPVEIDRPGLSYTVETVEHFASRFPDAERFFLIGEDLVEQFSTWREPGRIAALAQVVVLTRVPEAGEGQAPSSPANRFRRVATRRIDVSSTEVRRRARDGRSIRGFVPDAVAEYIRDAGLYR